MSEFWTLSLALCSGGTTEHDVSENETLFSKYDIYLFFRTPADDQNTEVW
jgi:hypothetical protein